MSSFAPAVDVDDVLASSLETVESLPVPRDEGDSDQDWEKIQDDVAVARATLAHNLAAHVDENVNSTLTSFTAVEVDDTTLSERLQEMDAAMARLMMKGDEHVVVTEQADILMEDQPAAANSSVSAGDFVPEAGPIGHSGDTPDDTMGVGYPTTSSTRAFSSLPSGTLEEKLYHIEGFPPNFPGIGKRSADLAQQFTQAELGELFSKLKTESWSRPSVERVLDTRFTSDSSPRKSCLLPPFSKDRRGVGHSSLGQLEPGQSEATLMCPNCFCDWQRMDNKVEGKCKLCQHRVIAVGKGPPSAGWAPLPGVCSVAPMGFRGTPMWMRQRRRPLLWTLVPGRSPPPSPRTTKSLALPTRCPWP